MKKQHKFLLRITLVLAVVLTVVLFGSKLMQKYTVNPDPKPLGYVESMDVSLVDYTIYRLL